MSFVFGASLRGQLEARAKKGTLVKTLAKAGIGLLTVVLLWSAVDVKAFAQEAPKDGAVQRQEARNKKPKIKPGFPQQGEMTFEVILPVDQDSVTETVDGPYGPMTVVVTSEAVPPSTTNLGSQATVAATTEYSRRCKSEYWFGVSARFTIYTSFRYNYYSVTWMGDTTETDWSIPAYFWSGERTWNDWASGWKYAWGNGRATLKWGVGWLATSVGNVHNSILVDAWGNCTAKQTFKWF